VTKRTLHILLLLIPCLPILFGLGKFIYPRYSEFSDLTISHLPNAVHIVNTIRSNGFIPLWSDLIMAGYPFSADPLSGIWYPPGWIGILIPAPYGFNICLALHLFWGGLGMGKFLERSGLQKPAALLGGIAFAAMPKLFAHLALGHVSLVYAISWFPWLLVAQINRRETVGKKRNAALLPGVVLGIIALADIRCLAYAGFMFFFYWLWHQINEERQNNISRSTILSAVEFAGQVIIGLGIAAVQILPLIQLTSLSTRAHLTPQEVLAFSLPLKKVANLFIPEFGGYGEWIVYPGGVIIFLCILVVATPVLRKKLAFWLILFGASLLLSFGSNLPFMNWLGAVPGASLLRVPPRMMFVAGIALIVLASHAYDALLSDYLRPKFDPLFWMVAICTFFFLLILISLLMNIDIGVNLRWGTAFMLVAVALIGLMEHNKLPRCAGFLLIPVFLLIDLLGVNLQSIQYRPAQEVYQEGEPIAEFLNRDMDVFRVYSPALSPLPPLTAARAGIEAVNAINPLQLSNFAAFMVSASGVKRIGYSVTIPALDEDNLIFSNISSPIDAEKLGLLNVKYVIAGYPIENPALGDVWNSEGVYIYQNTKFMPRVWIEDDENYTIGEAKIVNITPGMIAIEAEGPGKLVVSTMDYPGWRVQVDGKPVEKIRIANLFVGVRLDPGLHQINFTYSPYVQYAGIGISLVVWLITLIFSAGRRCR